MFALHTYKTRKNISIRIKKELMDIITTAENTSWELIEGKDGDKNSWYLKIDSKYYNLKNFAYEFLQDEVVAVTRKNVTDTNMLMLRWGRWKDIYIFTTWWENKSANVFLGSGAKTQWKKEFTGFFQARLENKNDRYVYTPFDSIFGATIIQKNRSCVISSLVIEEIFHTIQECFIVDIINLATIVDTIDIKVIDKEAKCEEIQRYDIYLLELCGFQLSEDKQMMNYHNEFIKLSFKVANDALSALQFDLDVDINSIYSFAYVVATNMYPDMTSEERRQFECWFHYIQEDEKQITNLDCIITKPDLKEFSFSDVLKRLCDMKKESELFWHYDSLRLNERKDSTNLLQCLGFNEAASDIFTKKEKELLNRFFTCYYNVNHECWSKAENEIEWSKLKELFAIQQNPQVHVVIKKFETWRQSIHQSAEQSIQFYPAKDVWDPFLLQPLGTIRPILSKYLPDYLGTIRTWYFNKWPTMDSNWQKEDQNWLEEKRFLQLKRQYAVAKQFQPHLEEQFWRSYALAMLLCCYLCRADKSAELPELKNDLAYFSIDRVLQTFEIWWKNPQSIELPKPKIDSWHKQDHGFSQYFRNVQALSPQDDAIFIATLDAPTQLLAYWSGKIADFTGNGGDSGPTELTSYIQNREEIRLGSDCKQFVVKVNDHDITLWCNDRKLVKPESTVEWRNWLSKVRENGNNSWLAQIMSEYLSACADSTYAVRYQQNVHYYSQTVDNFYQLQLRELWTRLPHTLDRLSQLIRLFYWAYAVPSVTIENNNTEMKVEWNFAGSAQVIPRFNMITTMADLKHINLRVDFQDDVLKFWLKLYNEPNPKILPNEQHLWSEWILQPVEEKGNVWWLILPILRQTTQQPWFTFHATMLSWDGPLKYWMEKLATEVNQPIDMKDQPKIQEILDAWREAVLKIIPDHDEMWKTAMKVTVPLSLNELKIDAWFQITQKSMGFWTDDAIIPTWTELGKIIDRWYKSGDNFDLEKFYNLLFDAKSGLSADGDPWIKNWKEISHNIYVRLQTFIEVSSLVNDLYIRLDQEKKWPSLISVTGSSFQNLLRYTPITSSVKTVLSTISIEDIKLNEQKAKSFDTQSFAGLLQILLLIRVKYQTWRMIDPKFSTYLQYWREQLNEKINQQINFITLSRRYQTIGGGFRLNPQWIDEVSFPRLSDVKLPDNFKHDNTLESSLRFWMAWDSAQQSAIDKLNDMQFYWQIPGQDQKLELNDAEKYHVIVKWLKAIEQRNNWVKLVSSINFLFPNVKSLPLSQQWLRTASIGTNSDLQNAYSTGWTSVQHVMDAVTAFSEALQDINNANIKVPTTPEEAVLWRLHRDDTLRSVFIWQNGNDAFLATVPANTENKWLAQRDHIPVLQWSGQLSKADQRKEAINLAYEYREQQKVGTLHYKCVLFDISSREFQRWQLSKVPPNYFASAAIPEFGYTYDRWLVAARINGLTAENALILTADDMNRYIQQCMVHVMDQSADEKQEQKHQKPEQNQDTDQDQDHGTTDNNHEDHDTDGKNDDDEPHMFVYEEEEKTPLRPRPVVDPMFRPIPLIPKASQPNLYNRERHDPEYQPSVRKREEPPEERPDSDDHKREEWPPIIGDVPPTMGDESSSSESSDADDYDDDEKDVDPELDPEVDPDQTSQALVIMAAAAHQTDLMWFTLLMSDLTYDRATGRIVATFQDERLNISPTIEQVNNMYATLPQPIHREWMLSRSRWIWPPPYKPVPQVINWNFWRWHFACEPFDQEIEARSTNFKQTLINKLCVEMRMNIGPNSQNDLRFLMQQRHFQASFAFWGVPIQFVSGGTGDEKSAGTVVVASQPYEPQRIPSQKIPVVIPANNDDDGDALDELDKLDKSPQQKVEEKKNDDVRPGVKLPGMEELAGEWIRYNTLNAFHWWLSDVVTSSGSIPGQPDKMFDAKQYDELYQRFIKIWEHKSDPRAIAPYWYNDDTITFNDRPLFSEFIKAIRIWRQQDQKKEPDFIKQPTPLGGYLWLSVLSPRGAYHCPSAYWVNVMAIGMNIFQHSGIKTVVFDFDLTISGYHSNGMVYSDEMQDMSEWQKFRAQQSRPNPYDKPIYHTVRYLASRLSPMFIELLPVLLMSNIRVCIASHLYWFNDVANTGDIGIETILRKRLPKWLVDPITIVTEAKTTNKNKLMQDLKINLCETLFIDDDYDMVTKTTFTDANGQPCGKKYQVAGAAIEYAPVPLQWDMDWNRILWFLRQPKKHVLLASEKIPEQI